MRRLFQTLALLVSMSFLVNVGFAMVPQVHPYQIVVKGKNAFWTDYFGRTLYKANLPSGRSEIILQLKGQGDERAQELVADEKHLYFATSGTNDSNYANGRIVRVSLDGKNVRDLVVGQVLISGLSQDSKYLYWTTKTTLSRVSKNGGTLTVLVADEDYPHAIAVDGAAIYWASTKFKSIRKLVNGESKPKTLAANQADPDLIELDGGSVYWTNSRIGFQVMSVSKSGGVPQTIAISSGSPTALAVGQGQVFWAVGGGQIWRYALQSRKVEKTKQVSFSQYDPVLTDLAVDGDRLYWVEIEKKLVQSIAVNLSAPKAK